MTYTPAVPYIGPPVVLGSMDQMRSSFLNNTNPASTAYPAANLAFYVPLIIERPVTVKEVWVETGTLTTSNGVQIGLYDTSGNRLFATSITVATASDTVNSSGMTDYVLDAGSYYLAFACDGTRAFLASVMLAGVYAGFGVMEQTGLTGSTLPTTWTPVLTTRAYLPLFGLNCQSVAI